MSQFPLPFVQGGGALSCTDAVMQKKSDNLNHKPAAAEYIPFKNDASVASPIS